METGARPSLHAEHMDNKDVDLLNMIQYLNKNR
jgi:hypothetical protein